MDDDYCDNCGILQSEIEELQAQNRDYEEELSSLRAVISDITDLCDDV